VFKLIPVTHVDSRNYVDEPFNNPRNFRILEEGVSGCSKDSISVSDSHYMDLAGIFLLKIGFLLFFRTEISDEEEKEIHFEG
jgi:hypothetical protein